MRGRATTSTSTSSFGVGRREGHDAAAFYARFDAPVLSDDDAVAPPVPVEEPFVLGDARRMDEVADASVALVVTSPPYFVGKVYEEELRAGAPTSYLDYLGLLRDVFAECRRVLEPGGRLAVNVANLGRKPYRSLSADVTRILQDDLGLLLRGEVVWRKSEGASGSCAWGSFRSPANPVLRDTTERVVVASKGRFDRAGTARQRTAGGRPARSTTGSDEFMAATLDVWDLPAESARRVGHPAPFPVELPERLIHLYTYEGDLVLDPFMGSGTALVAAARTGRRYVGYDLDPAYVELARRRVDAEGAPVEPPAHEAVGAVADSVLAAAGFTDLARDVRQRGLGLAADRVGSDALGRRWCFEVSGAFTVGRAGLGRTDEVWRALGRASVLASGGRAPVVLLTSHLPRPGSDGDTALRAAGPAGPVFDVVDLRSPADRARLARYAEGGCEDPLPGFWPPFS